MDIREVEAKSILNRCGIPGIDFVVNPYTGCRFACKYCYASFMGRFMGKAVANWGEYVYAKMNQTIYHKEFQKKPDKAGRLT